MTAIGNSCGFSWSARFDTGLLEIDRQHRMITQMVGALARMAGDGASNAEIISSVCELREYTALHFKAEDELMRHYQLDAEFVAAHSQSHVSLTEQINIVYNLLAASETPNGPSLASLLPFLHKWMIFHVVGTDMRMARMILALQRGDSREEAIAAGQAQQTDSLIVLLDTLNELYDDQAHRSAELQDAHRSLRLSEARYALAQRAAHIGSWEYDLLSGELTWSVEMEALLGHPVGSCSGGFSAFMASVHPDDRARVERSMRSAVHQQGNYDIAYRIVQAGGTVRWVAATGDFVYAADGAATRLVGVIRDITEQHESQQRLEETNTQLMLALAALERHASDLTRLNTLNEGLQSSLTSAEAYEVLERTLSQLQLGSGGSLAVTQDNELELKTVVSWGEGAGLMPSFPANACWAMRRGLRHALQTPDAGPRCKHFDKIPTGGCLCQPLLVLGETLGLLTVVAEAGASDSDWARTNHLASMVCESLKLALSNIRLRDALHEQAIRDPLTHLLNRRYLDETFPRELHRAARERRRLAVVMIDLDHFKLVNDTWGHEAGDAVLAHVAKIVQEHLRASDLACRFGGEEFVVVMLGADVAEAQERIESIAATVRQSRVSLAQGELPAVTFSAGVAEAFVHGDSADQLLRAADHALYAAKEAGRDRVMIAIKAA